MLKHISIPTIPSNRDCEGSSFTQSWGVPKKESCWNILLEGIVMGIPALWKRSGKMAWYEPWVMRGEILSPVNDPWRTNKWWIVPKLTSQKVMPSLWLDAHKQESKCTWLPLHRVPSVYGHTIYSCCYSHLESLCQNVEPLRTESCIIREVL